MSFFNYNTYNIPEVDISTEATEESSVHILIETEDFTSQNQELLAKILSSVGLTMAQVNIVQLSEDQVFKINDHDNVKHLVLSFGIPPKRCCLQIDNKLYTLIKISKSGYLFSDSLTKLTSNNEGKRALWVTLKQYFNK